MRAKYSLMLCAVLGVFLVVPGAVLADVMDDWTDLHFSRFDAQDGADPNYDPVGNPNYDPNNWDPNNPDWTIARYIGDQFLADANNCPSRCGMMRLYVESFFFPFAFIGAECNDGNMPAQVPGVNDFEFDCDSIGDAKAMSTTFFDDSDAHYIVVRNEVVVPLQGIFGVWMNFNWVSWQAHGYQYEPRDGWMSLSAYWGTHYDDPVSETRYWCVVVPEVTFDPNYYDPNYPTDANYVTDPNYLDSGFKESHPNPNGFYLLMQFDPYGFHQYGGTIDANDPNCHWIRCGWWNDGDEWDGEWQFDVCVVNTLWATDPNDMWTMRCGTSAFAAYAGGDTAEITGNFAADIAFDNFEAKWGYYGERFPNITLTLDSCKACDDYILYPNSPHPGGGGLRQYVKGTVIVLEMDCTGNKNFNKWKIYGPNDANIARVDKNEVLYLTMSGDYTIKGICKCGGGGIEAFAAAVLLLLGLGVMIRRLR